MKLLKKIIADLLEFEARLVLKKYHPKIVGVTGNVGKTSTKEAIASVLRNIGTVRASEKSYNSEFGLPLTILDCKTGWKNPFRWLANLLEGLSLIFFPHHYPEWLVLEIGADKPGDIKKVAKWLQLNVAVITRIGEMPVHVEFFKDAEALAAEKSQIIYALTVGGDLVLNGDDSIVSDMKSMTPLKATSYGFKDGSVVRASNNHMVYETVNGLKTPMGVTFKVDYDGKSFPIHLNNFFGSKNIYSALAAIAVGVTQNINIISIIESIGKLRNPPGRLHLLPGIKNTIIVDDTYNASPTATKLALESLHEAEVDGRKIAALGDMLELGKLTVEAHEEIGRVAAKSCDILFAVGPRAKLIYDAALGAGMSEDKVKHFDDSVTAGRGLDKIVEKGDIILVKGSQRVRMEKCVEEIMAEPERKKDLLVRQDPEWMVR
ncbi:MAG: hypothetical protein HZA95_01265 [Candidatus Vogelbacteria bacterium]|nr:hypothetical protein [Candidatus Vogelbacteria bacterium]